jgi:uncharacterized protein (TIGR03435 family)
MKLIVGVIAMSAACGQTPNPAVAFEVASVKPAPPIDPGRGFTFGSRGGGVGSVDPTRYTCSNCTLMMLLTEAYDIKPYQLSGPGWMNTDLYEISAKVPQGATREQVRVMIQNLLAERFKLTLHHEQREMQAYELVVAKGGPKFTEHVDGPPKAKDDSKDPVDVDRLFQEALGRGGHGPDKDGYPMVPKGCMACGATMNGKTRLQANGETMAGFAARLTFRLGKPVNDATGLKGKYDYSLTFDGVGDPEMLRRMRGMPDVMPGRVAPPPPPSDSGPPLNASDPGGIPIEAAIQSQLGLKLELKKVPADMIVVDHAEKKPTEN